jgi:twinkle protein
VEGYKVRTLPKAFTVQGNSKACELFGQAKLAKHGKRLLITGGELDAMSAWQMLKDKYPQYTPAVVSLPKGENVSSIKDNLEFIKGYDEVLIYTDMDDAGRKAADDIAKLVGHKAKLVETSEKDASDMLTKGKEAEFYNAYFNPTVRKPEGIVSFGDISLSDLMQASVKGYDLPFPTLNRMMGGLKKGELTTLTAGSGIGKSTLARELGYHLSTIHNLTIGNLFLEEGIRKTITGYIAIDNNIPLSYLRKDPSILTNEQWETSYNKFKSMKGFDHFGSMPTEDLMDRMRYLAYGEGCDFIILDHLSMVFSGQNSSNERKDIDMAMTELAAFCNESGVGIIVVVHLSRNKGKTSFNEGGQISLNDLRGSAALEQLSWNVLALERNQQEAQEENKSVIRVLKNRETGWTGQADTCEYNFKSGRLLVAQDTLSDSF